MTVRQFPIVVYSAVTTSNGNKKSVLRTVHTFIIFLLVLGGKNSNFRGNDHKYTFHGGFVTEIWFPETLHDIKKNMRFSVP